MMAQPIAYSEDRDAWKLFVFRKHREALPTRQLLEDLCRQIQPPINGIGSVLDALVRAGEIETGLEDADAGSPAALRLAAAVDELAAQACAGAPVKGSSLLQSLKHAQLEVPEIIQCSHPEGFSYYGLNPLDFADLAARVRTELAPNVAVVGIRSVGSTLGAVVAAQLRALGASAERITVRPDGEPYRRQTTFTPRQQDWLRARLGELCDFVVVDEGPGFSGSTFLSVAQALVKCGIPDSRIVLMGSRPFPHHAAGASQAEEWKRFRSCTIDYASHTPPEASRSLGDGAWREVLYPSRWHWPACWVEQERIKHLSSDGKMFFKFEGLGRFGALAREQAAQLAEAGFSPRSSSSEQGYAGYEFVRGRPMNRNDLDQSLLSRIAEYCAFRLANFPARSPDVAALGAMARNNLEVEFGKELRNFPLEVPLQRPVYPDCRMLPHEWLVTDEGCVLKTDAVGHAEGHQLPGPVDIAWDLAGTIIEWDLTPVAAEFFLEEYRRQSGDPAEKRLRPHLLLYAVLRMSQCRMASVSMARRREAKYLRHQYEWYSARVRKLLQKSLGFSFCFNNLG